MKFLIIGILLAAFSAWFLVSFVRAKKKCSISASAKIVEVAHTGFGRDGTLYTPVYEFHANGQTIRGKSASSDGKNDPGEVRVGDTVEILYNESDPSEFVVEGKSNASMLIVACLFLLIGLAGIALGIRTIR